MRRQRSVEGVEQGKGTVLLEANQRAEVGGADDHRGPLLMDLAHGHDGARGMTWANDEPVTRLGADRVQHFDVNVVHEGGH
jgi:hypothetical protein